MSEETKKHQDHVRFLEKLDIVNQTIQGKSDIQEMMYAVLDAVMSIFDCDRSFLVHPCDPDASTISVPMERNKDEYPGAHDLGLEVPVTGDLAEHYRVLLDADGPVEFGPESEHDVPAGVARQFEIKSMMSMAIYPRGGKPWEFGIHQCAFPRVWPPDEKQLFEVIGHRLADGLSVLLSYQELTENRKFLDSVVENIPNMVFVKDAQDLRYLRINKAAERLMGYSRREMYGKNDYDFFSKKEADFFTAIDREVLEQKKPVDIPEESIKTRLRGERILHTQKMPIPGEDGDPLYLLGISQDITEQKLAEGRLIKSEHNKKIQNQIAQIFLTVPDEEMYGEVLAVVLRALQSEFGVFGFIDTNGDLVSPSLTREIWNECQVPDKSIVFPRDTWGESLWGRVIREKRALYSNGPFDTPEGHVHIDNFLSVPIVYGNEAIGLISVANNARGYTGEDKGFLESVAGYISPILNARLQRDRQEQEMERTEMELQQSNDLLRAIIEAAPVAIIGLDLDGKVQTVWNPAAEKMLGWKAQEVMGRTLPSVSVENQEEYRHIREIIRSGKTVDGVDVRRRRCGGSPIDYSIYASPLYGSGDHISGNIAVLVDITEREQMKRELISREREYRTLLGIIPDFIVRYDSELRRIYVNPAWEKASGLSAAEVIGVPYTDIPKVPAPAVDEYAKKLRQVMETGVSRSIEFTWENAYGVKLFLDYVIVPEYDNHGKIAGVLAVGRDITARKQTEEAIRKLTQAIEQSPASIVITDVTGTIEFVNTTFTQITGYTRAEAVGRNPGILKSGETTAEEYSRLWKTISSGEVWGGEFHNRKKNGELFWEHATIAPVKNAENVITHYVAVKEDITDRKKLEEQLLQTQKMEAVGQLAGGVAHDFNNMLGVITGYAELALEKAANDDSLRQDIEEIREAALRSIEITRQLLAFARKQTIVPKILDLNRTIEGMLKLLRRLIGENIDLSWVPGPDLWPVKMDPSQIDQILANLCVNAGDAISGVGTVRIETQKAGFDDTYCAEHEGFSPGQYVMLAVSDNGRGMDKRTMDKIFEPFFTTKRSGEGTGLGLATVYGIVKQNAGFINVYSEPGHGATFTIYLPRHAVKTEHIGVESRTDRPPRGHETILVVEDESAILKMVTLMLEKFGYTVLASSKPGEAMRIASENAGEIDLLITDLVMPGMTGLDLAKNLNSLYPELKCLFMSGYMGNVIDMQEGVLKEGVNFIQKPFSQQELAAKVREALDSI